MYIIDRELYHLHYNKIYRDTWKEGNELVINNSFESNYLKILKMYDTSVNLKDDTRVSFDLLINDMLKKEQTKEVYIDFLKKARHIIYLSNLFKREMALEQIREKYYPNLPSRKHSVWLCDENSLEFWYDQISKHGEYEIDLFKVLVTGKIFKSSDIYIPDSNVNYEENLKQAKQYWNPKNMTEEAEKKAEYIFQGKLKILSKIDYNK